MPSSRVLHRNRTVRPRPLKTYLTYRNIISPLDPPPAKKIGCAGCPYCGPLYWPKWMEIEWRTQNQGIPWFAEVATSQLRHGPSETDFLYTARDQVRYTEARPAQVDYKGILLWRHHLLVFS